MIGIPRTALTVAGAAVTIVCFVALYRGLDTEAVNALRHARTPLLGLCFVSGVGSLVVRTERWRQLLLQSAYLPFAQAFWTSAAGQMLNTFLPARMGDAFRGMAAATSSSRAFSLGTIVVERVLDTGVVVLAALGALAVVPSVSWWMKPSAILLSTVVVLAIATLAVLPCLERHLLAQVRNRIPSRAAFAADLLAGMRLVRKPLVVTKFVAFSIAAWGLDAFGITLAAQACQAEISFGVGVLLVTVLAFSSAIPATGSVGVVPVACAFVLPAFGVGKGTALAIGIVLQSLNLILTATTGSLGLWLLRYRTPSTAQPLLEGKTC